jgi:hypothetical protein
MSRRREVPPAQQLESLRQARDFYSALAEQLRNSPPAEGETEETRLAREQNARRVAAAYENSFNIQHALLKTNAGAS